MKRFSGLLALLLFSGLVAADPRIENKDGILHMIMSETNQDDEIKIGGLKIPIYEDDLGFAQGFIETTTVLPCGFVPIAPPGEIIVTDDSEGICTMVDDGGTEYTSASWTSVVAVSEETPGKCLLEFMLECMDGIDQGSNLDQQALAEWDSNGNVTITNNGDESITASGYTANGTDSIANSIIDSTAPIDGKQYQASYDIRATDENEAGCMVEIRLQRLAGGDGAPIVVESAIDVVVGSTWERVLTTGTGAADNRGLKALITGGIESGVICQSIDVRRRFISEI